MTLSMCFFFEIRIIPARAVGHAGVQFWTGDFQWWSSLIETVGQMGAEVTSQEQPLSALRSSTPAPLRPRLHSYSILAFNNARVASVSHAANLSSKECTLKRPATAEPKWLTADVSVPQCSTLMSIARTAKHSAKFLWRVKRAFARALPSKCHPRHEAKLELSFVVIIVTHFHSLNNGQNKPALDRKLLRQMLPWNVVRYDRKNENTTNYLFYSSS